jgi:hypothetical protein
MSKVLSLQLMEATRNVRGCELCGSTSASTGCGDL